MTVKELRTKSLVELKQDISDLKAELFMLRFKNSTGQLEQPHKISLIKKDIARVFTVIHEVEAQDKKAAPAADTKASKAKVEKKLEKPAAKKPAAKKPEAKKEEEAK